MAIELSQAREARAFSSIAATCTFGSTPTAGCLIVACVGWQADELAVTSVTDTAGNTYAPASAVYARHGTTDCATQIWYAWNCSVVSPHSVTVRLEGNSHIWISIAEFLYANVAADPWGGVSTGNIGDAVSTFSFGNVTPDESWCLVVASAQFDGTHLVWSQADGWETLTHGIRLFTQYMLPWDAPTTDGAIVLGAPENLVGAITWFRSTGLPSEHLRVTQLLTEAPSNNDVPERVTQLVTETSSQGPVRLLVTQVLCETISRPDVPIPPLVPRRFLIRRLRQSPHVSDEQFWFYVSHFQLDLETGLGRTTGQGIDPQIMLQYSDDGGHTWSNELWVSAGVRGAYAWRAIWRRLGRSRDRVWRVTMSDPVPWRLLDAYVSVDKGVS